MADYQATESDLLLGDMLTDTLDISNYLAIAWREIESELGFVYVLPLPNTLDQASNALLRTVHAKLTSGRIILAQSSGDDEVNSYGRWMVNDALRDLKSIVAGIPELAGTGLERRTLAGVGADNRADPRVIQYDAQSPFDAFDNFVGGRLYTPFTPGGATN